jgi:hypothetical protein
MGNMPGMDISAPASPKPSASTPSLPGKPPSKDTIKDTMKMKMPENEHAGHQMPGRD